MPFDTTVHDAAQALGVSTSRVYQLIDSGALGAQRLGNMWLLDGECVAKRAASPVLAGRPKAEGVPADACARHVLMCRTHEVLVFDYEAGAGLFGQVVSVIDPARVPIGVALARGARPRARALRDWWAHRAIPGTREGLAARLRELGLDRPEQLPFPSLGLSLSDQYWVRPAGLDIRWEDVNYFQNDFDLAEGGWLASVGLKSPDNTSEGELPKRWTIEGGRRVLLKGSGPLGQEPFNEVLATELFERLLPAGTWVPYELRQTQAGPISACACFLSDREEYIPACYVMRTLRQPSHRNDFQHMIECLAAMGVADAEPRLSQMIVCDDILGNFDRHLRNFGVVRDVETMRCRMAPLFDSGSCLWCNRPMAELAARHWNFETKPFYEDANRQLRLVNDYSWLDVRALEGFPERVREVLGSQAGLPDRAQHVAQAVEWRIGRILAML